MEAVEQKLDFVLAARTPDYLSTYAPQVAKLRELAEEDRPGLVERVAYTWFNRLAALRYLDARGWHPFRARVLTPASPEETQPELLRLVRSAGVPNELQRYTDPERLNDLLDGRIPSVDPQGEVYRHLVLAACRFYHRLLPDLFEPLDDETELLLPDDLLTEHSVVNGFRAAITDEDCAEVEVLGWLYQFYISEKKDAVMARKSVVPSEDIPAVTQLFTPHWIVRYLVENSLGRLWLLNRPGSRLREQMPYFIEGEPEEDFLKIERPEEIRLIDPAVGSGHMLVYAFDLLYAIYEEEGYAPSEIAGLILKHNLYGADIDPRAAQLASLALVLKARERSRRFFQPGVRVRPNVIALQDVRFEAGELREYVRALDLGELFHQPVLELLGQFENATTFGSLIQPVLAEREIRQLRTRTDEREIGGDLLLSGTHQKVLRVLEQAEYLAERYDVAVMNPPYMGISAMNGVLKAFANSGFPRSKADLFAMFIERALTMLKPLGLNAMITMQSWMFLSSYGALRKWVVDHCRIYSMLHLGARAFDSIGGEVVQATAFVIAARAPKGAKGVYIRLTDERSEGEKERAFLASLTTPDGQRRFHVDNRHFAAIPGSPIAYWLKGIQNFAHPKLEYFYISGGRNKTHNNDKYVRFHWEVSSENCKWVPYSNGGEFRKYYGNEDQVVDWSKGARSFYDSHGGLCNPKLWGREGITWSLITTSVCGFRIKPSLNQYSSGAPTILSRGVPLDKLVLPFLNSLVCRYYLNALNPTINTTVGDVLSLPLALPEDFARSKIEARTEDALSIAEGDWNAAESSRDFTIIPLLRPELKGATLAESWEKWECHTDAAICRMQELETENNRLWIEAYDLQGELAPEVPKEEITLARADRRRDVAAFLSYAVGCMMGRYSLDAPGLVLADAGSTVEEYLSRVGRPLEELTFAPDADGILPVLDGEWFEDDIVARTRDFLRATFGEATLRENLRFIEESLGKDLRRYFLTDFYRDHLQTYKKRPIYWTVQSPKRGFGALIYLHRYTRDTLNRVLNGYLREYETKLRNRLEHLARVQVSVSTSARDKTAARKEADKLTRVLNECQDWERHTLLPLAQQRIELDLDDGVKVNYLKLGEALAPIAGLAAKDDD